MAGAGRGSERDDTRARRTTARASESRGATLMRRYAEFVVNHPIPVLVALVLLSGALMTQLRNLHRGFHVADSMPQEHPNVKVWNDIRDMFGIEKTALLALHARDGNLFTDTMLRKLVQATHELERVPGVIPGTVLSMASARVKRVRAEGDDLDVEPFLGEIPTQPAALEKLRDEALNRELYTNLLVSRDGSSAAIIADFTDSVRNPLILERLLEISSHVTDANTEVYLTGAPVLNAYLERYSARIGLLFPLTILVVALIHYEAFRTLQAMALPLLTAVLSLLLSLSMIGWLGYVMDPWNAITPVIILALAAGHAVQMLKRYYEEYARTGDNKQAIVDAMVSVGPVMLTAGGIAALGFGTLATFGVASVRIFGLVLASGVAAALVVEMTLIPAARALLPPPRSRESQRAVEKSIISGGMHRLSRAVVARPKAVVMIGVLLSLGVVVGISRLRVNNSFREWFYASSQPRIDDAFFNRTFGGGVNLYILLQATERGALEEPEVLRALFDLETTLRAVPEVGKVMSYVDFLRDMHNSINPDGSRGDLPDSRRLVAQYLLLYAMNLGPEELGSLIDSAHERGLVTVLSRSDEAEFGGHLIANLRKYVDERFEGLPVQVRLAGGTIGAQTAMNEVVVHEKIRNMEHVATVIFVLSSIALRSVFGGVLVIAPLVLAVLVNLGVMGWLNIWLAMSTATITAMGMSLGADFSIYLLFRIREERRHSATLEEAVGRALDTSGLAVCFVSSAIAAGYLMICLAGFRAWTQLGGLTALMVTTAALATLTVLPGGVLWLRPRFLERDAEASETLSAAMPPVPAHGTPGGVA